MKSYNTWYLQAVDSKSPPYVDGSYRYSKQWYALFVGAIGLVGAEPVMISVHPRVPEDRYYVLQFMDLFTYNYAYIGSWLR